MQKKDPTDDVMAAIARIVENPATRRSGIGEPAAPSLSAHASTATVDDDPEPLGANGYSRLGPGPLPALRFKWTARRDAAGDYYVDETIGDHSRPVTTGPMAAEDAIALVDTRVKEARERFDRLKAEMSVRGPEPEPDANS